MKIKDMSPLDDTQSSELEQENTSMHMPVEFIQPWANIVVKFRIPDKIFKNLLEMYEYTITQEKWSDFGDQLVGQVAEEPEVTPEIMSKYPEWTNFCIQAVRNFIVTQTTSNLIAEPKAMEKFKNTEFLTKMNTMWFVRQRPNEYNPIHIHTNCKVSSIAYLKTPKHQIKSRKEHYESDGKVCFTNNSGTDFNFAQHQASFNPKAGDMYVFPALQHHCVWPYRSKDPDDLRVSISFNADFIGKDQLEKQRQSEIKMYEAFKKKESENDKSTDVSNVNKSG